MNDTFSSISASLGGIQANLRGLHRAAHDIAVASVDRSEPLELTEPLVRSLQYQRGLEASADAMRRADDALGTLIDTFA